MFLRDLESLKFDFHSKKNHLLLNPRLSKEAHDFFTQAWNHSGQELASNFAIATSGTTARGSYGKLVILSKAAVLASATAVNQHLAVSEGDIWIKAIPDFHVGGLGILARATLSGARVFEYQEPKWNPQNFYLALQHAKASLISLVPTQIFDLLRENLRAPNHVRAVLIGGAALADSIYHKARHLGWRLLPSYGMTETCSMVACADPNEQKNYIPKVLSHAEIKLGKSGLVEISGSSLLTGYIVKSSNSFEILDPKAYDESKKLWFSSEDYGELTSQGIQIFGRDSDFFKVGGEGVSLLRIENIFSQILIEQKATAIDFALLAAPDERLGYKLVLLSTAQMLSQIQIIVDSFNEKVAGFEKIRDIHLVTKIPRTELGKVKKAEALELVAGRKRPVQS